MDYLKNKAVYLTGPITAAIDDGVGWREYITPRLLSFGLIVDDPVKNTVNGLGEIGDDKTKFKCLIQERRFEQARREFSPIVRKDLRSVDKSDFLIFYYDPKIPMFGTIHELVIANQQRKPILMFVPDDKVEGINPWVFTLIKSDCLFTHWDAMFMYLDSINRREAIDYDYWTMS